MEQSNHDLVERARQLHSEGKTWKQVATKLDISVGRLRKLRKETGDERRRPMKREELKVFISHRHDEKQFADIIKSALVTWGLTDGQIYQSSSRSAEGPTPGNDLSKDVREFLWECNLVIWIYTTTSKHWSWCTYEIGVADDPKVRTRIVTLSILGEEPVIRRNRRLVTLGRDDIQKFVKDFFTKPGFFPGFEAYWPKYGAVKKQADDLYAELANARKSYSADVGREHEPRWGYFRLEVHVSVIEECRDLWEMKRKEEIWSRLKEELRIVGYKKTGLFHFGYDSPDQVVSESPPVSGLAKQWREQVEIENPSCEWLDELVQEVWRSRMNFSPQLSWKPIKSAWGAGGQSGYFYPVLVQVHKLPNGSRQYDFHSFVLPQP